MAPVKRKTKIELEKLKKLAEELYFNTDKSQKEIADIVGVSEQTLSGWAGEGRWSELKALEKASRGATIRRIYDKLFKLAEVEGDKSADAAAKWAAVLEKLEQKKVTLPNKINVFKQFDTWLLSRNPELAKQISQLQHEFLLEDL